MENDNFLFDLLISTGADIIGLGLSAAEMQKTEEKGPFSVEDTHAVGKHSKAAHRCNGWYENHRKDYVKGAHKAPVDVVGKDNKAKAYLDCKTRREYGPRAYTLAEIAEGKNPKEVKEKYEDLFWEEESEEVLILEEEGIIFIGGYSSTDGWDNRLWSKKTKQPTISEILMAKALGI